MSKKLTSIRLPRDLERRVGREAKLSERAASEVMRDAMDRGLEIMRRERECGHVWPLLRGRRCARCFMVVEE